MSEFACKKCVSKLDKLSRVEVEAQKLRTELINKLMGTTLRHRTILRWAGSTPARPPASPPDIPGTSENTKSFDQPSSSDGVGDCGGQLLKRPPPLTPQAANKRRAPLTPRSANKPESKRARPYQSPLQSSVMGSPLPRGRQWTASERPVIAARALFPVCAESNDTTSSTDEEPHGDEAPQCKMQVPVKVYIHFHVPIKPLFQCLEFVFFHR